jgi:hypothetical protein
MLECLSPDKRLCCFLCCFLYFWIEYLSPRHAFWVALNRMGDMFPDRMRWFFISTFEHQSSVPIVFFWYHLRCHRVYYILQQTPQSDFDALHLPCIQLGIFTALLTFSRGISSCKSILLDLLLYVHFLLLHVFVPAPDNTSYLSGNMYLSINPA